MSTSKTIALNVITPLKRVRDLTVVEVILPAHDGLLGVLPDHAPLVGQLDIGIVRYFDEHQTKQFFFVDGGFFHVVANTVTVLTSSMISPVELTDSFAQEQMERAQRMPMSNYRELNDRRLALKRAKHLITIAKARE